MQRPIGCANKMGKQNACKVIGIGVTKRIYDADK